MHINWPWKRLEVPSALPMRGFGRLNKEDYTWEDWEEETSKKYPFRYWLHRTLPRWFSRKWSWFEHTWYWIRTHTYNRYHILDLRSNVGYTYKWGWIDRSEAIMLASFKLLRDFVENEDPLGCLNWKNEAWYINSPQVDKDAYDQQIAQMQEVKDLYDWWMVQRDADQKKHSEMQHNVYGRDRETEPTEEERDECMKFGDYLDEKDDEMLIRLMKVRKCLWT